MIIFSLESHTISCGGYETTCYAGGLDSFKEKYQDYYNAIDKKMPDFLKYYSLCSAMFKTAAKKKSQGTLNIQHARLTSMARNRYCTEPRQKLSSEERNKLTLIAVPGTNVLEERFERAGIAADRVKNDPEKICGFYDLM